MVAEAVARVDIEHQHLLFQQVFHIPSQLAQVVLEVLVQMATPAQIQCSVLSPLLAVAMVVEKAMEAVLAALVVAVVITVQVMDAEHQGKEIEAVMRPGMQAAEVVVQLE